MTEETLWLPTPRVSLHARSWLPEGRVAGRIALIHGLGEHSGRYRHVAERLARAGYGVLGIDQQGHGETPGRRGHVPRYDDLLDGVDAALDHLRGWGDRDLPTFLYGHSLGGGVVLNHALRRQAEIAGVVATSPLLRTSLPLPQWKVRLGKTMSRVWPTFAFVGGVDPAGRSHDPTVAPAFDADPLAHEQVTARLAVQMLQAGRWALENAAALRVPTLILHGGADPITCPRASTQFAAAAGNACELRLWPDKLHELQWETNRHEVLDSVVAWLDSK